MTLPVIDGYDLQQLVAALPVAVYVCEAPGGEIRLWNRRAAELWGREPDLGSSDDRFCGAWRALRSDGTPLPPDQSPMAEALRTGVECQGEATIERPDGSRIVVSIHIVPLRDAAGRLTGAINAFQDVTGERHQREALRRSEARYRAIVEDQLDLVCRFGPDGRLTFANDAYCRYFGLNRSTCVGQLYAPVVHPDDLPRVQDQVATLSPTNPCLFIENRVMRADGVFRWTEWTNHALYDPDGTPIEIQAAGRDTTDRHQGQEDAARLASIVTNADAAIYGMTIDGVTTSWNHAAERMFGYTAAEAVGRPTSLIVPADRADEAAEILDRLRAGETITQFETERVARNGSRIPVSLTVSPIRDAAGRITGISKIARDITSEKQAAANLRRHLRTIEGLYRLADRVGRAPGLDEVCEAAVDAIVEIAGAPRASILVFDDQGVMRFKAWRGLSPAYRAAADGHSPWSPESTEFSSLLVEDVETDPGVGALREVILAEGIRALAFVPLAYRGRLLGKFMVYYNAPHHFPTDEMRLATTVAHHIAFGIARAQADASIAEALGRERTARLEADTARAEAERASQAKDQFLAMLSHELRNPLGVLATAVTVLDQSAASDDRTERPRAMIRRQTDHLARLLQDLLDVARISTGQIQLDQMPLDLRAAVDMAAETYEQFFKRRQQSLTVTLPPAPVVVLGDAVRLQQVLGNLLDNASKYTDSGGAVSLVLQNDGVQAVLRVRDTGAGVPPDQVDLIFDLFAQVHPAHGRVDGGLGIGLTIARRILDLHGGSIRAHSEGLGQGTEFVVTIPLTPAAEAPIAPRQSPVLGTRRRRILVIDDFADGREMLVAALELHGHEVFSAATGQDGVEQAIRHRPDLAFVDIGLPDMPGYEVAREVRRHMAEEITLVALTGYGQPADRARSEAVGFHAHLVKPVDPWKLLEIVEQLT